MPARQPPSTFDLFGEVFEIAGRELWYLATRWPIPRGAPRTNLGLVSEIVSYPACLAVAVYGPGCLVLSTLHARPGAAELAETIELLYMLMCPLGVGCVVNAVVLRVLAHRQACPCGEPR
jgi:hypothetical protein